MAKRVLYRSGALSLYHRLRNRHTLTVVLFHRVLDRADERWPTALPEWTVSDRFFETCLRFFARHYNVVRLDEVLASYRTGRPLPPRSLLITFDDGYADNEEYALPRLRAHGLPAVVFVFSDAVNRATRPWTEDLLAAHLRGEVSHEQLATLHRALAGETGQAREPAQRLLSDLLRGWAGLSDARADALLESVAIRLARRGGRAQMLTVEQLRRLAREDVAIGSHGRTHTAFPLAQDVADELCVSRHALAALLGLPDAKAIASLAFPYGLHSPAVDARARAEGYELLFTVERNVTPLPGGRLTTPVIGRVNISEPDLATDGALRPEVLALTLFRVPHAAA